MLSRRVPVGAPLPGRTVQEILRDASKAMDAEDERKRRARDPLVALLGIRRRSLLDWLVRRR
jgi:hypothetical protein